MKSVKEASKSKIPIGANLFNSHTLGKVKMEDNGIMKLKSRINPHDYEDKMRFDFNKDCATCPSTGVRTLESITSLFNWTVYKTHVTATIFKLVMLNEMYTFDHHPSVQIIMIIYSY